MNAYNYVNFRGAKVVKLIELLNVFRFKEISGQSTEIYFIGSSLDDFTANFAKTFIKSKKNLLMKVDSKNTNDEKNFFSALESKEGHKY